MEFKLALNRFFVGGILFAALVLAGCASTQKDVSISAEETQSAPMVEKYEERLIALDGEFILNEKLTSEQAKQATEICADIDKSLAAPLLDKVVESRLLALKGRTLLLTKNKADAAKLYAQANKKYANDVQLKILGRRLGEIKNISEYKNQFESEAITIEAAIESFENSEYDIATGLFDSAFLASDGFYKNAYSAIRERAWNLKNIEPSDGDVAFWLAPKITVGQMMELAQRRPGLLDYYTGGKKMDSKRLFQALAKAGLLDSVSEIVEEQTKSKMQISEKSDATRILAARFLWNLFTNKTNANATKYSERYRKRENAKSPVVDIEIFNEDFDAVLGVIEKEIMSLVDGKNFNPEGTVTAPEFDGSLKKVQ